MKRTGNLFDQVVTWENLRLALGKALRRKRTRAEVREFCRRTDQHLAEMGDQLRQGTFPFGRCHKFLIRDPKERLITAPCFPERVVHHAIMNVCEPVLERWLVHDTYACRTGRGRDAAVQRARHYAQRHPCFLKLDVRKYFPSISHSVLLSRLERVFKDARLLELFYQIISSFQGATGRGLPIGALTSQHFANFYLGWCDRFVKETLRAPGYVRYMDDMLLWDETSGGLHGMLGGVREFLDDSLELQLKPFPYLNRSQHGVDFLGCRVFPDHVVLNRRSRVRFRRRLWELETRYLDEQITELELQTRATALVAFTQAAGVKSWHFRRAVLQRLPVSGRRPGTG